MELMDRILPVVTLLLGAVLTWCIQRTESGRSARLAAGELLAELRKYVWSKGGDEDWLNLQVFLGKLRVHLRGAGVPELVIKSLNGAAEAHWNAVEEEPDVGWVILGEAGEIEALNQAEERAHLWLHTDWRRFTQRRGLRRKVLSRLEQDRRNGT